MRGKKFLATAGLVAAVGILPTVTIWRASAAPAAVAPDFLPLTAAVTSSSTAQLTWDASIRPGTTWQAGRDGVDTDGYGAWQTTLPANSSTLTFRALRRGATYTFFVKNLATGEVAKVKVVVEPDAGAAPAPGGGLVARATGPGSASVTWDASARPAKGWQVSRDGVDSDGYGAWSTTVGATESTLTFNALRTGATYTFTVTNLSTGKSISTKYSPGAATGPTTSPRPTAKPTSGPTASTKPSATTSTGPTASGQPSATAQPTTPPAGGVKANPRVRDLQVGQRSGLIFDSGVFAHNPERVGRYEQKTGRKVGVWQIAPQRNEGFDMLLSETKRNVAVAPADGNVDFAIPLLSRAEAAQIGAAINAKFPHAYVRPGWEFNMITPTLEQNWPWATQRIGNEAFVQRYKETIDGIRSTCPSCLAEWNVNAGSGGVAKAMQAWPGDAYVDVIGVDVYDWKNEDPVNGSGQLNEWAAQARTLNKPVSLPEWGAHGKDGRGDNPAFVNDVMGWIGRNRDLVLMASYFDEPEGYIQNSVGDGQMPKVGEALKTNFTRLQK